MSDERIDLEVKVTFLEKLLGELNEVIFEQGKTLDRFEKQLKRLEGRLEASTDGVADPGFDKPPHY